MNINVIVKSGLVVVAAISGYAASAATTLRINMGAAQSVTVGYRQDLSSEYTPVSTSAGVFHATQVGGDSLGMPSGNGLYFNQQTWTPNDFYTFCTDVGALPPLGNTYTYEAASLAGQVGIKPGWSLNGIYRAAYLYNVWTPQVVMESGSLNNVYSQAGLQLAIWETLYDTDGNLDSGRFQVNSVGAPQVLAQAKNFLSAIPEDETLISTYSSTWLRPSPENQGGGSLQGLMYVDTSSRMGTLDNGNGEVTVAAVPDSGFTICLMGIGFGMLGMMGWRKS